MIVTTRAVRADPVDAARSRVRADQARIHQVVLHNDEINTVAHVVACLRDVFGHPETLAVKIMLEAHTQGRAIAEVEDEPLARRHQAALIARKLIATVEAI